ncbi:hypothetical protein LSUE1_G008404 [Lachnellula suecica]|uniref:Uncharacterized protein n=1 Tax=Lachnellula suecica TaxID=602035 RepID=A0A8T9C3I8_9HELO|nr:hypothetical protein LSUE1_G008404 [Lachnellula suecica]
MDSDDHHGTALGLAGPYDHIDIGWVEQRLNEQAGVRRSRLAAYFEGVMEFYEEPPVISRSPTPDSDDQRAWQGNGGAAHYPNHEQISQRRSNNKGVPRLASRRSTSDSDATDVQQRRKRRQVTPVSRPKINYKRTSRSLQQIQRGSKVNTAPSRIPSAHRMETRSKTLRIGQTRYS